MQPGQTIEPGDNSSDNKQPPAELPPVDSTNDSQELKLDHQLPEQPKTPQDNPSTPPQPQQEQPPAASTSPSSATQSFTAEPHTQWAPGPVDESPQQQTSQPADVQWSASEFIEHQKSSGWHLAVVAGGILLAALLYLITRDIVSVIVIVIAAILFSIIGSRKPRTLNYSISPDGVTVGDKLYPFADIKSFSVVQEGAIQSIQLMPLKRFMPSLSMYYPPEQEEAIISTLANYIPHEERRGDTVDHLMKRLRF